MPLNLPPVLDPTKSPSLGVSQTSAPVPVGGSIAGSVLVTDLIKSGTDGNYSDANGDPAGIAIVGVSLKGTLWYTTNSGASWTALSGKISTDSALVLKADASTRVYFQPDAGVRGTLLDAIVIKAWDQSGGLINGQRGVNTSASIVGNYDPAGATYAQGVAVRGEFVYFLSGSQPLRIINTSIIESPTLAGTFANADSYNYTAIAASKNSTLIYVGNYSAQNTIEVLDVANPLKPISLSRIMYSGYSGWINQVAVFGNNLYVADDTSGLHIINVSDPRTPAVLARYTAAGRVRSILVDNDIGYLTNGASLQILDLKNPARPVLLSSLQTDGIAQSAVVKDGYAYVAAGNAGLLIVNVNDVYRPKLAASLSATGGGTMEVVIEGNFLFRMTNAGVQIYNISDPITPTLTANLSVPYPRGIAVKDGYLYVASATGASTGEGLYTIDVRNLASFSAESDGVSVSVNSPPTSASHSAVTSEDTLLSDNLPLASDVDGDPVRFELVDGASNGVVKVSADGKYTYQPNVNFNGNDVFTFSVHDGRGGVRTYGVNISVSPVNDAPTSSSRTISTLEDSTLTFSLPEAWDADGDTIAYAKLTNPANGSATVSASGAVTYIPYKDFNGIDAFTFRVSDGKGGANSYTITINVAPVNDAPTASDGANSTLEDLVLRSILPTALDVDGDSVTYALATMPSNGVVNVSSSGAYSYQPNPNFNGFDSFKFTISDGNGGVSTYIQSVRVLAVNDAPALVSPLVDQSAAVGAAFTFEVPSNTFSDVDGDAIRYSAVLESGSPLPAWLGFDPTSGRFSGRPLPSDEGRISVKVIASDGTLSAQDSFDLSVAGGQQLTGTPADDVLRGDVGRDSLSGGEGRDTLQGAAGSDQLSGGPGDDLLDGGSGTDTASFAARASGYRLLFKDGTFQVQDRNGLEDLDTLVSIERLQFSDKSIVIESRDHGSFADLPSTMYQFFILAFGAAPGVEYLQQCADAYRGGASVKVITNVFTSKSQFTDIYPTSLSNRDMATKLVTNVVGTSATQAAKDEAIRDITGALENGLSRGDMIFTVFSNLAGLKGDAKWGGTAQLFFNQIAVAKYYTETMNQSTTDRATLAAAISAVTATSDVATDAAIVTLIGQGLLGG